MRTIKECRQRAQDCLRLATTATDFFAQDALVRRAAACETMAETLIRQRHRTNVSVQTALAAEQRQFHVEKVRRGNTSPAQMLRLRWSAVSDHSY